MNLLKLYKGLQRQAESVEEEFNKTAYGSFKDYDNLSGEEKLEIMKKSGAFTVIPVEGEERL